MTVFRADASPAIGGGHVVRCSALAAAAAARGWRVAFAAVKGSEEVVPTLAEGPWERLDLNDGTPLTEPAQLAVRWPDGADWLVVDHYDRDAEFEAACRPWARRVVAIDDLANRPHAADVVINAAPGRTADHYSGLTGPKCAILTGPAYALLDQRFPSARTDVLASRSSGQPVRRVLISFGLADGKDFTSRALRAVARTLPGARVDIVLGLAAPHRDTVAKAMDQLPLNTTLHLGANDMAALMCDADLAIGAAGTTSWERCCLGLPSVAVVAADNQRPNAQALDAVGAATVINGLVGAHDEHVVGAIAEAVAALAADADARQAQSAAAAALCDGRGCDRVLDVMAEAA